MDEVDYRVNALVSENDKLRARIQELEHQLSLSIESTGEYLYCNGNIQTKVLKTTNPEIVITTRDYIERLICSTNKV